MIEIKKTDVVIHVRLNANVPLDKAENLTGLIQINSLLNIQNIRIHSAGKSIEHNRIEHNSGK